MAGMLISLLACSPVEKPWKPIFNGKDLQDWKMVGPGAFKVEDGSIRTVGGMGLLYYAPEKIGNAELKVVYTVKDNDSNGGVFIRIPDVPADPWFAVNKGYEVQIDNGIRHVGGEYHCSGVLYSLTRAMAHPQKAPGEWNEMIITLDGSRTKVSINGETVTDFNEGDAVPAKTRDFEPERGARPLVGFIGIQNHDSLSTVLYKEIAIRPLN